MALTDADIIAAVNGAGFTSEGELQSAMVVAKAFADALQAAATANNTTVAALASSFANRASLGVQMQALQAQITAVTSTQQTTNAAAETQRQSLQAAWNALNQQLATA